MIFTKGKIDKQYMDTEEKGFSFEVALGYLKKGSSLTRKGWNGKGLFITLQTPTETSKMTKPYLFITTPVGSTNQFGAVNDKIEMVPWLASQTDLLSEDWLLCGAIAGN